MSPVAFLGDRMCPEGNPEMTNRIARPRIMVCEDEALVAMGMVALVEECEREAIGPFARSRDALLFLKRHQVDGAILDVELRGGASTPLARLRREAETPIIVVSGFQAKSPPPGFAGVDWLSKPVDEMQLRAFLMAITEVEKRTAGRANSRELIRV